ncbi:AsmA family protein [Sulfuricella sp.]|uniref:AsmA family protein n=1 Tax=Sulfuricella sp. TaxID=2099377 RepID=UPI002C5E942E|nr:AsmA family protein [Sulfuricella sp.]HUX65164.1 AsmA family protein [Sulfuricella sp.]
MPRRTKIALAVAAGLIAVPAVALVVLLNFDWNRAKPWLNARSSEALGRPFAISGDLSLTWEKQAAGPAEPDEGWRGMIPWPHWVAHDIHVGNPPAMMALAPADTSAPAPAPVDTSATALQPADMASIKQLAFSLNPWALLGKKISIPVLRFDSPVVSLLRSADGKNNWTFKNVDKPSPWQLELQRVIFTKGSVHLSDAVQHADVTADIDTLASDPIYGVAWHIRGKFNGEAVSGNGKAGAVLSLQHQTAPYPIMAHLRMGKTVIAVEGSLTKPTDLAALDMRLKLSGVSMARLYALSGIVLPETPPFATEGHLIGTLSPHGGRWIYEKFSGKVGSSDIGGSLDYQSKQPRALLSGTVVSHLLHFSDLAPLIGADSNASKAKRGAAAVQPENKALPVEPFKTERWTSIDADIKFSAEKIIRKKELPINKLTTNVHLQDGVLSLLPLNFDMAGGNLSSNITLDGSGKAGKNAIKATMKVTARHLKLKQLFPALQPLQASAGEINGDASLSAVGNSVASLLGASNGEIKTLINQGTVSKLLLEEMGLNIGNVILTRLVGDKQVKLNCMATDFGVTNGLMQTRSFIIDTDDALLAVSGNINLAQEQLDLTINTHSEGLRVLSLRAPLYVRGSFKQPRVSVDKGVLAMKAGGAIGLAALAPVAALIPLINAGPGEDSECARLLADARVKPVAPPPGKTYHRKAKPNVK